MIDYKEAIQVGPLLVRRVPSSTAEYRAGRKHYWRGYLCPALTPKKLIGSFGKLVEVTSIQQLKDERDAYRLELDPYGEAHLTYYEVIEASV